MCLSILQTPWMGVKYESTAFSLPFIFFSVKSKKMYKLLKNTFFFAVLFCSLETWAATSKNSGWLGTFSKKEITENYKAWVEAQMRYGFDQGGANQILYRTGLLYDLSPRHEFGFLYAFIQTGLQKEHRFTVQHSQKYGEWLSLNFSHRMRLEARFLEDNDDDAGRFRYLIRGEGELQSTPSFVLWNEVFVNTSVDSWTGDYTLDRNRLFVGFKIKVFNSRTEIGYLNQFVRRRSGDVSEHVATMYWFF